MINIETISILSVAYIAILFLIALKGDKLQSNRWQPYVYSLTLAIFCTTWTFYGLVHQTISTGWLIAPTYAGAIIVFTFGWKFMARMISISKQENITTIADFIATRYGHYRPIAILVSIISLFGIVPYIALQLKAVSTSFHLITDTSQDNLPWIVDPSILVAILMGIFSILFGTRSIDAGEHQRGMMLAIAFESLIKLIAFIAIGIYVVFIWNNGLTDIFDKAVSNPKLNSIFSDYSHPLTYLTHALIGGIAIFALPRQFHTAVVENQSNKDLSTARWLFPLYLLMINFFVAPIAIVGYINSESLSMNQQFLTLAIPIAKNIDSLAILAYIGGLSAGTSMVIIASVTLSTMLSNEILLPLLIRFRRKSFNNIKDLSQHALLLRRVTIVFILTLSFFYYRLLTQFESLAGIGLLSFVAVAQFAPALLLGMVWRGSNRKGAMLGMLSGFAVWFYCLLVPVLANSGWINQDIMQGIFGIPFLKPYALFGLDGLDPVTHGTLWSLLINTLVLVFTSLQYTETFEDRVQANIFVSRQNFSSNSKPNTAQIRMGDLKSLLLHFVSEEKVQTLLHKSINPLTKRLIADNIVNDELLRASNRLLSSILGRPAAKLLMESFLKTPSDQFDNFKFILDEASEVLHFNRELLSSALMNIDQGISIVNKDLNIIAWNQKYRDLYDFPEDILYMGAPVEQLIRYATEKGAYGYKNSQKTIQSRLQDLKSREARLSIREATDGTVIEVRSNPMPDGLYITTYTDITNQRNIEQKLRQINESLEIRVSNRTQELTKLNKQLERANQNKTKFLAAAGHDLVQPINSASLFASSLVHKLSSVKEDHHLHHLASNLEKSLDSSASLLSELLEISKLDSKIITPEITIFPIRKIIEHMTTEYEPIAKAKNIQFNVLASSLLVKTDPELLKRILQNLISNAIRYTPENGKIVFGVKREKNTIWVQVCDNGVGIEAQYLDSIFDEFHRLKNSAINAPHGLGLGLSIVRRICDLLQHPIEVISKPGSGSCFRIKIPSLPKEFITQNAASATNYNASGQLILCIDNEKQIIEGLEECLTDWGYNPIIGIDTNEAIKNLNGRVPSCIIMDYHLNNNQTGIQAIETLFKNWKLNLPCIFITADYTQTIQNEIKERGFYLIKKPVKPIALRSTLNHLLEGTIEQ